MQVGQTASRTLKVTSEHVRLYTEIAGVVIALYQSVRGGVRAPVTGDVAQVLGRAPAAFSDFAARNTDSWLSVVGQNP